MFVSLTNSHSWSLYVRLEKPIQALHQAFRIIIVKEIPSYLSPSGAEQPYTCRTMQFGSTFSIKTRVLENNEVHY
jgi:hypothetical protein